MDRYYFAFRKGDLLLERRDDGSYTIPFADRPPVEIEPGSRVMDVAMGDGVVVKACRMAARARWDGRYELCGLRESFYKLPYDMYLKAGKCEELLYWDAGNKYCGACGSLLEVHTAISKKCPVCGREVWPQLSTAVIVLVHRGSEALLVHAKNFKGNFFGLVAGFVETGETLEEAVHREVMEETGIRIKNLRYFGSQPWPYPCGLMVGFNADYDRGTLRLQRSELSAGAWFGKDNLPQIPEKLSIARKLIDAWLGDESDSRQ